MRTKTLAFAAALLAAGIASSVAQSNVYSLNIVGYVNKALPTGFSLIGNPLNNGANDINTVIPNVPEGTLLYKFAGGAYTSPSEFYGVGLGWDPNVSLAPGEGAFIKVPTAATVTFVGEVATGSTTTPVPAGFSMKSSVVPQSGGLTTVLGFPGGEGDLVYFWNTASQTFGSPFESYGALGWDPSEPSPAVGEGFFVKKVTGADWIRNFNP